MSTDEERYAAYFSQADEAHSDPLTQVRTLRSEQLAVCDLRKQAELAQLRQSALPSAKPPPTTADD